MVDQKQTRMNQDIQLETPCADCDGRGCFADVEEDDGVRACQKCNGSGFVPTQMGARILDLIRHNSRVKISAAFEVSAAR